MVTVGIAAYNVGQFIEKSLLSVLNQDYPELEILVIDDNSKDNTYNIVEQISRTHHRGASIRIIRNDNNQGTANVRNQCIDEAKGNYIFFLDGDDYIASNAISKLYCKAVETQAEMVIGAHCRFVETGRGEEIIKTYRYKPGIIYNDYAIAQMLRENHTEYYPIALWNKLFQISFIRDKRIRCVPSHFLWEDIYFAFQTSLKLCKIAVIEDVTMMWRIREGSAIQTTMSKQRMNTYLSIFDQILNEIAIEKASRSDHQIPVELYYILSNRYLAGFITRGVMVSRILKKQDKCQYLKHIGAITDTELKMSDLLNKKSKRIYRALESRFRYWLVYFYFVLHPHRILATSN